MTTPSCRRVRHWLQEHGVEPPPLEFVAHTSTCLWCRGALATLLLSVTTTDAPPITCARCEQELAAYLDHEQAHGVLAAAERYPQIWMHLWVCPECAELSVMMRALMLAEQHGALPALPIRTSRPMIPVLAPVRIPVAGVRRITAARQALGVAWSGAEESLLVAEEPLGDATIAVSVQREDAGRWRLDMELAPPISGMVTLQVGTDTRFAPLDPHGRATFSSTAIETAGDDAELVIVVQPDDAPPPDSQTA